MSGTIDNLNFEIILRDEEFSRKVKANIKLAEDLNISLTKLLELQSKVKTTGVKTPNATQQIVNQEKIAAAQKRTAAAEEALAAAKNRTRASEEALSAATARRIAAQQRAITATARSVNAQTSLQRGLNRTTAAARTQSNVLGGLKGLALQYLSIRGVASFISSLVRVTGEFELQKTTLAAMLGDLSKAQSLMSDIKGLAVQSPFQFKELATYAKQLTAFAVPAEHLFETTKMLADVSAGLGVGMDRIVLAYGQVKSAAFLRGQEVRQFTEAGIPILNELAKQFEAVEGQAISVGEVFDRISSRMVSFEMVNKVFKDLTSEGGKFYKMQETQAETLRGKISNLKDAYEIMLNEMGSQKSGFLKNQVDNLRGLMTHWEAVGKAIMAVIVALGVYKGTLAAIAVAEKIAAIKALVHKWQLLNSVLAGMGKNVSKMKTAWTVFGTLAKTAMGLAAAAAGALLTIIISSVSKIGELKRELNGIVASEALKSDKSVRNLDLLVEKLKDATQGSQEYRDIISQLNRQYGEYLPKVLKEADAYNEVAAAAQYAAEAIKSKAKASAYDRGMETIEEKYGKDVESNISSLIKSITTLNPSIAQESASRFVSTFIAALKKEGGRDDAKKTFTDTFNSYFGEGSFDSFIKKYEYVTKDLDFAEVIKNQASNLSHATQQLEKEEEKLKDILDARFTNTAYDSYKEEQRATEIETEYQKALLSSADSLNKKVLTQKEYNKEVKKLDIKRLEDYIALYKELGRQDKVDFYQGKLDALKVPEGWRGDVQKLIESMDLDKGTSFGLWADETTNSVEYVDKMVKRYKELKEEIDLVSPFDEKQVKRLQQNKELIEAIAKALNLDLAKLTATKKRGGGESEEEKRLKRLISALRKLQDQYEKLKALGASDESIKKLFEGLYPELIAENGKDFVTDLKYLERGIKLAKDLKKIDANAGKKALVDLGGDEFSIFLKQLQAQNKEFKEASKAAEDYFKTLREWKAADFNLEGSGIVFDINKIVSDLNTANGKIKLKATKLRETFTQIIPKDFKEKIEINAEASIGFNKEGLKKKLQEALSGVDGNDIASIYNVLTEQLGEQVAERIIKDSFPALDTIKDSFTQEFGADAWDAFWSNFKTEGYRAIDKVADKEKSYERQKAQEKLNDLAQKYVSENTSNLNMTDWSDKTLNQINIIQEALRKLLDGGIAIEGDTLTALQDAGLTIDDLSKKIKELLEGKYNNTVEEKIKAIQNVTKKALSIFGTLGSSFKTISEGFDNEGLGTAGEYLSVVGEITEAIADCDALWESVGESAKLAADAATEVGKAAGSLAASLSWITMIIKVVLIVTEQIANAVGRASAAQRQMIESALYYNEVMSEYGDQQQDTIFGKNFFGALIENAKQAEDALNSLKKAYKDLNERARDDGDIKPVDDLYDLRNVLISWGVLTRESGLVETIQAIKAYKEQLLAARKKTEGFKVDAQLAKDMDAIIEFLDAYEAAVNEVKENVKEVFGQMAGDIASNMIDAFLETENALGNLEKSFQSLGRSILESLMSSMIIDKILNKYEDRVAEMMLLYGAGETTPDMFKSLAEDMQRDFESYGDFWNNLVSSWQDAGLLGADDEMNNTLAEGIKGITEDTANLLASYLNAIRADVAYSRTIWERMDKSTQAIATALAGFSSPSLMEYQAQIAANTYNTAIHTQEIMMGLRSVITADGGLSAIRVLQY